MCWRLDWGRSREEERRGSDHRESTEVEQTVGSWMGFLESRRREESKMALRFWPGSWEHTGAICPSRGPQWSGRLNGGRRCVVPLWTHLSILASTRDLAAKLWQLKWEARPWERGQVSSRAGRQGEACLVTNWALLLLSTDSIFISPLADSFYFSF